MEIKTRKPKRVYITKKKTINIEISNTLTLLEQITSNTTPGVTLKYIENISYLSNLITFDPLIEYYLTSITISLSLIEIMIDSGFPSENLKNHIFSANKLQQNLSSIILNTKKNNPAKKEVDSLMKNLIDHNHLIIFESIQTMSEKTKSKIKQLVEIYKLCKGTPFQWNLTALKNFNSDYSECSFPVYTKEEKPFLPSSQFSRQCTLVLDLDETLIHVKESTLLIRPGAENFLSEMSSICEVVIFTAATKSYADFAIKKIDPLNKVKLRLYRQHLSVDQDGPYKNIELLGRDLQKTVIVDNLESNFRYQKENGICIKTWVGDEGDRELINLTQILTERFNKLTN